MATHEASATGQPTRRLDVYAGIDLGTTYSKIAIVIPDQATNQVEPRDCYIYCIKAFGFYGPLVPTKCPASVYNGTQYNGQWLELFKLSLPHRDDLPHDLRVSQKLDMAMKEREALDMSAVDVTSKFLSGIWKHAHREIRERVDEIDKLARPRVVITVTVPVGWPADARKRLYQAFQSSDILGPNVSLVRKFVTEAEATGIAIMSTPLDYQGNVQNSVFQVGDTVIICDCGGGTTDLISYQVVSLKPFALQETTPGKCIFAGGVLLNETFLDLVRDKAERQCTNKTFKDLTDKDYHEFVESIWDRDLRTISFPCRESANFRLPVTFLGHQARLEPRAVPPESLYMTFTA